MPTIYGYVRLSFDILFLHGDTTSYIALGDVSTRMPSKTRAKKSLAKKNFRSNQDFLQFDKSRKKNYN